MSSIYREPGVVVTEEENPSLAIPTAGLKVVAVLGEGLTTVDVQNQPVVRSLTGITDAIPDVSPADVVELLGVGEAPGYFNYQEGVDFLLTDGFVDWTPGGSEPSAGATYYVSVRKVKDASFYEPIKFSDPDKFFAAVGFPIYNGVANKLGILGNYAFEGGAAVIISQQIQSGSLSGYQAALDKLKLEEIDILLIDGVTNSQVRDAAIAHVKSMSTDFEMKERVLIIGPTGLNDSVSTINAQAAVVKGDRVILVAPPSCGYTLRDSVTGEDARVVLSSVFAGAAIAGIMADPANTPATPLINKVLPASIDLNSFKYLRAEFIQFGAAGVLSLKSTGGAPFIVDQLTTDQTSIERGDIPIRMIKDYVRKNMRAVLLARYIPSEIKGISLKNSIKMTCQSTGESWAGTILNTDAPIININVDFDGTNPQKINVHFQIRPIWTLKYIDVVFSISR